MKNPVFDYELKVHPVSEFALLPWHELDPELCSRDWSFGRGGHGLKDYQYTISVPRADNSGCDYWVLPDPISAMLKMASECSAEEALRNARLALGIR